jgi:hypothetical protein
MSATILAFGLGLVEEAMGRLRDMARRLSSAGERAWRDWSSRRKGTRRSQPDWVAEAKGGSEGGTEGGDDGKGALVEGTRVAVSGSPGT